MSQKVGIPKGTRDFTPVEMGRRNYIFNTIKEVYRLYGFEPIETPAMELLSTLLGKYGEEGDKLLFRILNSGNFLQGVDLAKLDPNKFQELSGVICEKGLRYDLTVPLARFVVQHRDEIIFPFRRYQIQPVWRADRPQKGRYREFYQCDADVIGSDSLIHEAEIVMMIDEVFSRFGVRVEIKINNRKILSGMANRINRPDLLTDITIGIDKLEKIGIDNVKTELLNKGLTEQEFQTIKPIILLQGSNEEKLRAMSVMFEADAEGKKGVEELQQVLDILRTYELKNQLQIDLSLARGLNYYTGCIFEVKALDVSIGSICGGGRYDNLTGVFGMPGVPGVGISFGADRIYDVLEQLNSFPESVSRSVQAMFVNFGANEVIFAVETATRLRRMGVAVDVYPENAKLKKQLNYADAKNIPFVIFIGDQELKTRSYGLKNMVTGEQQTVSFEQLVSKLTQ